MYTVGSYSHFCAVVPSEFLHTVIRFQVFLSNIAQSAGPVEYADCTSAEG